MADEPKQDEEQPQDDVQSEEAGQSEEQAPEADASAAEPQEQGPEADASAEESGDSAESGEEAEEPGDGDDAAERAEDAATEAPEQPEEGDASGKGAGEEKAKASKDLPPGADLDPIALEPEKELSAEEKARLEAEAEEKARLEAEATAEAPEEQPSAEPRTPAEMAGDARYLATGKRKRSIARVIITPGDGKFEINRRSLQEYFPRPLHQSTALLPLSVTGYEGTVDVRVNVQGGGIGGQAGAIRHGIARALTEIDPELRKELKKRGFLTR
ncbi:MAG: 30S ribosomal protein S9, partial [Actinomycetota bacterium]|nr:30S ribosomal protein S9 [Actinomycetota bacterium]